MRLIVRQESPKQEAVAALLRESDELAEMLYPGAYRRPLNPNTLASSDIDVFIARTDELTAAGCCALLDGGDGTAELKRMIVGKGFRHRGVGTALLRAVEARAVERHIGMIRMEVGVKNTAGQILYKKAGYCERGPFGNYKHSTISLFFQKQLMT